MKYAFIAQYKKAWPIDLMCRLLGVKRNGFYRYQKRDQSNDPVQQEMLAIVKEIAAASDDTYGSRRMKEALNVLMFPVSRDKARKLMHEAGVHVHSRKKYKVTTNSNHKQPVFDNVLNRAFKVEQVNQVYAADITYLWTQ